MPLVPGAAVRQPRQHQVADVLGHVVSPQEMKIFCPVTA